MRIGIDGSSILPRRTGVGHYTNQLLRHLAPIDSQNEYVVFLNSLRHAPRHESWMDSPNFQIRRGRFPGPLLLYAWRYLNRPRIERLVGKVDVFHSPATYVPPQRAGACVTTVHDLYFLRDPESSGTLGGQYLAATLPRRLARIDRIIAVSNCTRDDLIELLAVPPEKIAVVYLGVDSRFRRIDDPRLRDDLRARFGVPDRYLLFVGTIEPRKNVERLIEAYAIVRRERPDAPPLVIAGGRGKHAEKADQAVARYGLERDVRFIGYVESDDLPVLYSHADLFVLPSLYEGFGLPVLEAMACGVPVVASANSSLVELVTNRGFLVDPMKSESIAAGILRTMSETGSREEYVRRGYDFAREMTWERCARQSLEVFREVVGEKAR